VVGIPVIIVRKVRIRVAPPFNSFIRNMRNIGDLPGFIHRRERNPTVKRVVRGVYHSAQHDPNLWGL